jgi:hypothetical protein
VLQQLAHQLDKVEPDKLKQLLLHIWKEG